MIFSIAERTGWTYHYILWGTSWVNIRLMLADAPAMKRVKKQPKKVSGSQLAAKFGLLK
nr:hypothetical protein [Mucilaginibacter sp. L294]